MTGAVLTVAEAAEESGRSVFTIRRAIGRGDLKASKTSANGNFMIPRERFEDWLHDYVDPVEGSSSRQRRSPAVRSVARRPGSLRDLGAVEQRRRAG